MCIFLNKIRDLWTLTILMDLTGSKAASTGAKIKVKMKTRNIEIIKIRCFSILIKITTKILLLIKL